MKKIFQLTIQIGDAIIFQNKYSFDANSLQEFYKTINKDEGEFEQELIALICKQELPQTEEEIILAEIEAMNTDECIEKYPDLSIAAKISAEVYKTCLFDNFSDFSSEFTMTKYEHGKKSVYHLEGYTWSCVRIA